MQWGVRALCVSLGIEPASAVMHSAGGSTFHARSMMADGGSSAGRVTVEAATVVGLFAYAPGGRAVVANVAPITGDAVSVGAISAYTVSNRPHASNYASASVSCSTSGSASRACRRSSRTAPCCARS